MPKRTGQETETAAGLSAIPFARKLDALKTYLREELCVEMAFLFGSRVTGRDMRESDVDIGVYFTRREDRIEWEEAAELRDHDAFAGLSENEYRTSSAQRRNVERWVENLVNGATDAAKILLASEAGPVPRTYREALESLRVIEGFDPSVAETLGRHAKLRNILAHEYLDVRFQSIRRFLQDAGPAFTYLLGFARSFADRPGGLEEP